MNILTIKRRILPIMAAVAALTACAQTGDKALNIDGIAPTTVSEVSIYNASSNEPLQTAKSTDGKFSLSVPISGQDLLVIVANNGRMALPVVAEEGRLKVDIGNLSAKGTKANDELYGIDGQLRQYTKNKDSHRKKLRSVSDDAEKAEIRQQIKGESHKFHDLLYTSLRKNQDNVIATGLTFLWAHTINVDTLDAYINSKAQFISHPSLNGLDRYVSEAKGRAKNVGMKFTDVESKDANGKTHKLSEYIGRRGDGRRHYVLVDFWASWCGPCMAEMPNVKQNWEEFRDLGFDVVGLSLDRDAAAWQNAITQGGYDWAQLSNLAFWNDPAAKAYNIRSIPANILIDDNGIIVAKDLRSNMLTTKLEELYY